MAQPTVLSKIFHHTCNPNDPHKSVQLGGVTCVFSDDVVINQLASEHKKMTKLRFFIPNGVMRASLKNMNEIKSPQDGVYKISITTVSLPKNGIQFALEYDPNKIVFSRDLFQRVTRERKLVFYFYDKQLLNAIKSKVEVPTIVHAALSPSVIIDSGHGGFDSGVVGCDRLLEKTVCLAVGKKVADTLKKNGIHALLTRDNDQYVSLEDRVQKVNAIQPKAFVSIHANAASPSIKGIETYYFDRSLCTAEKNMCDVHTFINAQKQLLTMKNKQLAMSLQQSIGQELTKQNMSFVDRSIKPEPLQLLMESTVPAALVEIGFLTNALEANLLMQDDYQTILAQGICKGIMSFI